MNSQEKITSAKRVLIVLSLIGFILIPSLAWGEEEILTSPSITWKEIEEPALQKDALQQIIDFVLENNSLLKSQKKLLQKIEGLPDPGKGFDLNFNLKGGASPYIDEETKQTTIVPTWSVGLEIPLFDSSKQKERIMDQLTYAKEVEKARQDYIRLKNSVTSELLTQLNKLSELQNEKKNQEELKSFLILNEKSLKQRAEAGLAQTGDLWELRERIMNLNTRIYNLSNELKILKREIAITMGGEKWSELKAMLDELNL